MQQLLRMLALAVILLLTSRAAQAVTFSINVNTSPAAGGSAFCNPNPVTAGASSICTVVPNTGYTFSNWSGDCTGASCTLNNVQSAKSVTANFAVATFAISTAASPSAGGTVTCSPNPVTFGSTSTCTATANVGYTFSSWSGDCIGSACTLSNVQSAKSVTATFVLNSYTITTSLTPPGSGTVSCSPNPVNHGSNSTCTATANSGFALASWSGDCTGTSCTLGNVQSAKSVVAAFTFTNTWAATGSMTVARTNHTATLLPSNQVLVVGGYNNTSGPLASTELFDPATGTWRSAASIATARYNHSATMLPTGNVLVVGGTSGSTTLATALLYDPVTNTWRNAGTLANARSSHTTSLLPNGKVLVSGGSGLTGTLSSSELYDPDTNSWRVVSNLAGARQAHTANVLPSGMVLVAGGLGNSGALTTAELFDPTTNTWTPARSMNAGRQTHSATLLTTGKVLVVGGVGAADAISSAELYDPALNTWTSTASLANARAGHGVVLLPSGKLMAVGGYLGNTLVAASEVFDPATNLWTAAAGLNTGRQAHTLTLLASGQILTTGGVGSSGPSAGAEVYAIGTGSWSAAGNMSTARRGFMATLLPSGKVLVAGGVGSSGYLTSAELYDPATDTWSAGGSMSNGRSGATATLLPSGKVLVAGGGNLGIGGPLVSAELYDPATNTWSAAGSMNRGRTDFTATLLLSGKVLVAGGYAGNELSSAEIYDPATNSWNAAANMNVARGSSKATLLPSGKVLFAGGGISAELYDPVSNTWIMVAGGPVYALSYGVRSATLLPSGKVLILGGSGNLASPSVVNKLYDPETNSWMPDPGIGPNPGSFMSMLMPSGKYLVAGGSYFEAGYTHQSSFVQLYDVALNHSSVAASMGTNRSDGIATLLPSGKLLVAGGLGSIGFSYSSDVLKSAELFDSGVEFADNRRPTVTASNSPLLLGSALQLTGTGFTGSNNSGSEASSGGVNNSNTNYPLVQMRRLENAQITWLNPGTAWTSTSYTSTALSDLSPAPYLVTVFVNGIPSQSQLIRVVKNWTVFPSTSSGGSISPAADLAVGNGGTTTFTVTANSGYRVDTVGGTCGGTLTGNTYITNAVTTDCTVIANFTVNTSVASGRLVNLSTRGQVQTGDKVMIGGFIIGGTAPKTVLIRAVGPNLANFGITGVLANPNLQLFSGQSMIAANDDWGTAANAPAIQATGLAPVSPLESAIMTRLNPGPYTAIVSGSDGGSGIGIVEVFEQDGPDSPLTNLSTRGLVQAGDNVMIGGFVVQGSSPQTVLIRAVGPNLANYGVTGVLANPTLQLYSGQSVIASNDDWGTASNAAAIQTTGLAPVSPLESAILITLQPGAYTAVVSGSGGGTGVGIVEVIAQ